MQQNGHSPPLMVEVPLVEKTFERFHQRPFSFFLDSATNLLGLGQYSFIGSDPFLIVKSRGPEITLLYQDREEHIKGNPFDVLDELLKTYALEPNSIPTPLAGGVVGYFGYDLCHFVEHLPSTAINDLQLPECYLAFYDCIVTIDHLKGKTYITSTGFPELEESKRAARARERLEEMEQLLTAPVVVGNNLFCECAQGASLSSNFTPQDYMKAVQIIRDYIAAGDVFQVNLSQRFEANLPLPPYQLYERLRQINPASFAAYLNFDELTILSASPERFLRVRGDFVDTRPMKGTRPRGNSEAADLALAMELQNSDKDRAENVMIVDLERNDLGRVCRFGSVKVDELLTLEKYSTVFQLTSNVRGTLSPNNSRIDLLKACFPGGSITGAPKVRAMEIIDELEPTKRGVYTGSIGYLSFDRTMDLNIVIRTIIVKDRKVYFHVGGGIIYDSEPEAEYQETLDKAKALFETLSLAPEMAGERRVSILAHEF